MIADHAVAAHGFRYWMGLVAGELRRCRYGTRRGHVRAATRRLFTGYYGELCQRCGRSYGLWWDKSGSWGVLMGSHAGLLCPRCFDDLLRRNGLILRWTANEVSRVGGSR